MCVCLCVCIYVYKEAKRRQVDVVRMPLIGKFPRERWAGVPWEHNIEINYISSTCLLVASFPICRQQLTSLVSTYALKRQRIIHATVWVNSLTWMQTE